MAYNALDKAKMNSLHKKITALSVGGTFLDGYDISIISVALIVMSKTAFDLNTDFGKAMIGASTTIGMLVGAILFGYITNHSTRKKATELAMWMNSWQSGENAYKDLYHTNNRHGIYYRI